MRRHLKNLTDISDMKGRKVGERQKISTDMSDMKGRQVGRQRKNRRHEPVAELFMQLRFFIWGAGMKKYSKKEAIGIVAQAAKEYQQKYEQRRFLLVCQGNDGSLYTEEASFTAQNFLHLTGFKTDLCADIFYNACLNGKLSESDFRFDDHGNTHRKLSVLPYLKNLFYGKSLIGEFTTSGIRLYADYFVGDSRGIMCLGFKRAKNTSFPSTLYQGPIREVSNAAFKVLAVFSKHYKNREYEECIYIAHGQDADSIRTKLGV